MILRPLAALALVLTTSIASAEEPKKPTRLAFETMRTVAYTSDFAKRLALPPQEAGNEPSDGVHALEFRVEPGPAWSPFYVCILSLYLDNSLPVEYPEEGLAGSDRLLASPNHFFLRGNIDDRRWSSIPIEDRLHHGALQRKYNRRAALATPDYEHLKKGAYDDIAILEFHRSILPGIAYIALDVSCFTGEKLRRRSTWQIWLKKRGGRDYSQQLRIDSEDFLRFGLPGPLLNRIIELSEPPRRYNAAILDEKAPRKREQQIGKRGSK
jgi:hypothetical protein